jgi:hypothetical protein
MVWRTANYWNTDFGVPPLAKHYARSLIIEFLLIGIVTRCRQSLRSETAKIRLM